MAWRSSGATNTDLITNLFKNGLITSARVRDAMLRVDRAHYCPQLATAYQDSPQTIGHRATISAPHMHASAVESLLAFLSPPASHPDRPVRVLDVGSGSAYLTHVLAEVVFDAHERDPDRSKRTTRPTAEVIGIEHIDELTELGRSNMAKSERGRAFLTADRVRFVTGDGRKGYATPSTSSSSAVSSAFANTTSDDDEPGFDAIHVGAGAAVIHPELVAQLRRPGRMFIPVEDEGRSSGWVNTAQQHIWIVDKDENGEVTRKKTYAVAYVPLTDKPC